MPTSSLSTAPADGPADFDFFIGRWRVRHHRLRTRLRGDMHWEDFPGTCEMRPTLGGLGNIDESFIELPAGAYHAVSIRRFDPATRKWSIWWIDSRFPGIDPPVHGAFERGIGRFYGDDVLDGRPIRIRFVWSEITPASARWSQAFSADGGTSWEDNWTMQFERVG